MEVAQGLASRISTVNVVGIDRMMILMMMMVVMVMVTFFLTIDAGICTMSL